LQRRVLLAVAAAARDTIALRDQHVQKLYVEPNRWKNNAKINKVSSNNHYF
jgi:hypothetical protein